MSDWRVLVVDDDREMRASLVDLLEAAGCTVKALPRASEVARALPGFEADVILSDVRMPGISGLELLDQMDAAKAPPVVLISAHGDIPTAVSAMQKGAYSFVEKPYDPRRLLSILSHAAEQHRMRSSNARLRARLLQLSGIERLLLGEAPAIAQVREEIAELAGSRASVLIQGETGTGKDLVARALHDLGQQGDGAFLAVNTAQLTPELLPGLAAQADGGTLFLDEIAACAPDVQAMLLRLIENQDLLVPGEAPRKLNLRVISATNEDVEDAMASGRLRKDLFFRLATIQLRLPALRARRGDIVLLTTRFLADVAQTYEVAPPDLSEDDIAALVGHDWPGNVRELRSVAERRVLMARRGMGSMAEAIHPQEDAQDIPHTLREAVAAFEREMIGRAIRSHEGRMDAVAEALGIGRRTLNEKIVKLGLDKDALL
ncbi:MAG: sigma-54-dependent transcriptional regulator [Paracoccaceae bacterium]